MEGSAPGRRARWRRAAACAVAVAAAVAGWDAAGDAGWFDARAVAVSDAAAREMLGDLGRWDAATPGERRGVAERVAAKIEGFTLLRVRPFGDAPHRHEIAVFAHAATGLEFSLIPGGTFTMGSPEDEADRDDWETQHTVTLTTSFLLCRTETTQAAWERVTGANPSAIVGSDHPVETVGWDEASAFCAQTGLRLPTEAEWEVACRAGTTTRFWSGDDERDLARVGWYRANTAPSWIRRIVGKLTRKPPMRGHAPVGAKAANPFGLHDVHGNVWEWCADGYGPYPSGAATDPTGAEAASLRVYRGGSWINTARNVRSAYRDGITPGYRGSSLGFRPARSVTP